MNKLRSLTDKNILLLQGPMGDFFKRLDNCFREQGANTFRIALNAGDEFFANKDNLTSFRGRPSEWDDFIQTFIKEHQIEMVFLFGDCRFYQRELIKMATPLKIEIFVFEEGYIRPNYITMERFGVNDFSSIHRERDFYLSLNADIIVEDNSEVVHPKTSKMFFASTLYYIMGNLFFWRYPNYQHHRSFSALLEACYGVRNLARKLYYKNQSKKYNNLVEELKGQYYFVPLQTFEDFQIKVHSQYSSIEEFIEEVILSFSKHAPDDKKLVFKHHPMDRGRKNYTSLINSLAKKYHLEGRLISLHDVHLPSFLKNAIATITINSTVGLSSIYHGTPTLVTGSAIYDIEGLTNKGMGLDRFWNECQAPDNEFYLLYKAYLIKNTQQNGSFYGRFPSELAGGNSKIAKKFSV